MTSILTKQEAATLLHVSVATIDRWRRNKGLPSVKVGGVVRFESVKLIEWLQNQCQESSNQSKTVTV